MPWVGFEPTIPASERAKTVHALDREAAVTCVVRINSGRTKEVWSRWSLYVISRAGAVVQGQSESIGSNSQRQYPLVMQESQSGKSTHSVPSPKSLGSLTGCNHDRPQAVGGGGGGGQAIRLDGNDWSPCLQPLHRCKGKGKVAPVLN
jgi:hypothetical protein